LQRARAGGENFAALFIDCDHFKAINDVWGHPRGDELLREVADSMRQVFDQTYLMARLGGDEFVVLKRGVDASSLQNRAFELQSTFARRMVEHDCQLTLSIGAAVFDQPPANLDGVIAVADELMYRVKRQGRNQVEFRKVTTTERFQAPHKRS
jgi:diguanylate cyclase (GGDEF)-like protein